MIYDRSVPKTLKDTQKWFASIITQPIDLDNKISATAPSGRPIEKEAAKYIAPSPTLRPAERIQIYNQQYWWRLLSALQENVPLLTRLFGFADFNQTIAIPYLVKYPPHHWSLNQLGERLTKWLSANYRADDREFILHAAAVDWAYVHCFFSPDCDSLDASCDLSSLLDKTIILQEHVQLFELPYELFDFRREMLRNSVEYWVEHEFPPLIRAESDTQLYFSLYRMRNNNIAVEKISLAEYKLLQLFKKGISIDQMCEWLEQQDQAITQAASENLQEWFQKWTTRKLLKLFEKN